MSTITTLRTNTQHTIKAAADCVINNAMFTDQIEFEQFISRELQAQGVTSATADSIANWFIYLCDEENARATQGQVRVTIEPFPETKAAGQSGRTVLQAVIIQDDLGLIGNFVETQANQPIAPHLLG